MKKRQVKLIASDAWKEWKKAVKAAKKSILIFSPYLNEPVEELLKTVESKELKIQIITVFEPNNFIVRASSLNTIIRLLESKYIVKHSKGLHAKVLLVDEEKVILGSQNFTCKGQKNKETSAITSADNTQIDKEFIKTLKKWRKNASEIPLDEAIQLSKIIEPLLKDFQKLSKKGKRSLREVKMYEEAINGTIEDCENYLKQYPEGKFIKEVIQLLEEKKECDRKRNV